MYLKGYQFESRSGCLFRLRKWDYGGDISHTNRAWNEELATLRSIPTTDYPLTVTDLDHPNRGPVDIADPVAFAKWMVTDFRRG